jgi:antitoxin component of RelBE/YafQ-DinJ toxin-antitoxin module
MLHRDLLERANAVCTRHGVQLADVLRGVVTRIATEGRLPTVGSTPSSPSTARLPFDEYDPRLWHSLQTSINAELAIELLASFIADCSAQLAETDPARRPHKELAEQLRAQRDDAIRRRQSLDIEDPQAIAEVLRTYGAREGRAAS